ncbi:hypothetical protein D9757_010596 [Collybiopsis confluens]|uniref:Uncharacterized protein n=1 Tax=Collybiopsis confluens TaxID=2823264 RepID=A0A8H5GVW7_9AGAR|nr:hypothetical protein D9757_010596 [Collybiopsis confluens]
MVAAFVVLVYDYLLSLEAEGIFWGCYNSALQEENTQWLEFNPLEQFVPHIRYLITGCWQAETTPQLMFTAVSYFELTHFTGQMASHSFLYFCKYHLCLGSKLIINLREAADTNLVVQ